MRKNAPVWTRKIIHMDMDAFFAAVEQLDHPEWRGKPVIVGGNPKSRGVVSTCSYEARPFGVRSAMPAAQAFRLCPQAIFVRPRMDRYAEISEQVMAVFRRHTPLVEQVSLDEAYLDVTQYRFGMDDPVLIAKVIKQNVHAVTHLTVSAGVAPNMFLAKIASDLKKPDGLSVIVPQDVELFLKDLAVRKIPGVGPVTEARLAKLGILTCDDLLRVGEPFLHSHFGKTGIFLYRRALGQDERDVEPFGEAKQTSTEETFEKDVLDRRVLVGKLRAYASEVFEILRERGQNGKTVVLKVKYFDFEQITRSHTLAAYPERAEEIYAPAAEMLKNKTQAGKKPVRLLGLGISGLKPLHEIPKPARQGELFHFLTPTLVDAL